MKPIRGEPKSAHSSKRRTFAPAIEAERSVKSISHFAASSVFNRITFAAALLETGPRRCPPEKRRDGDPFADEQSVL